MGRTVYVIKKTGKGVLDGVGGIGETAVQEATKRVTKGQEMNSEEYFITMLPEDEKLPAELTIEALKGYLGDAKTKNIFNSVVRFAEGVSDGSDNREIQELTTKLGINVLVTKEMQEDTEAMEELENAINNKDWNGMISFACEDLMERIPGVTATLHTVGYFSKDGKINLKEKLQRNAEETSGVKSQLLSAFGNKIEDGQNMDESEIVLEYNKLLINKALGENGNSIIKRGLEEKLKKEYSATMETAEEIKNGQTTIPRLIMKKINSTFTKAIDSYVEENLPGVKGFYTIGNTIGKMYPEQTKEAIKQANEAISEPLRNMQEKLDEEGANYGKVTQVLGDVGQNLGNMGVSATAGVVAGPEAGLATMAVSARGRSTAEAMEKGASLEKAVEIGNMKAAVEVGTEKLTGGVNVFGKGTLDDIANVLTKNIKNQVLKKLAEKGMEVSGEVLEETISDIVDTAIDRNTVDPNAEYTLPDWQNTALVTTLSTLTMNAITNGSLKLKQRASKDNTIQTSSENRTGANDTKDIGLESEKSPTSDSKEKSQQMLNVGEKVDEQEVHQEGMQRNIVIKKGVYNQEVKEKISQFIEQQLNEYEAFEKVYGKEFARKKLKKNIRSVYTNEQGTAFAGYYNVTDKALTICEEGRNGTMLTMEDILNDRKISHVATHEALHAILNRKEDKGTGILSNRIDNTGHYREIGRGANEGLTEWMCSKLGYNDIRYETETNYINQLEQAIGEKNVLRMGKGNFNEMAQILNLNQEELIEFFSKIDQIEIDESKIRNLSNLNDAISILNRKNSYGAEQISWAENYLEKSDTYRGIENDPDYIQFLQERGLASTETVKQNYFEQKLAEIQSSRKQNIADVDNEIFDRYFKREYEQIKGRETIPDKLFEKYSKLSQSINTTDAKYNGEYMGDVTAFNRNFFFLRQRQFNQFLDEQVEKINNGTFSVEDINEAKKRIREFYPENGVDEVGYKERYNEFLGKVLGEGNESAVIKLIQELESTGKLNELPQYQIITTETQQQNSSSQEKGTKGNIVLKNGKIIPEEMTLSEYSSIAGAFEKFKRTVQAIDPNAKIEWSGKNIAVSSGNAVSFFRIENNEIVSVFATNSTNFDKLNEMSKTNEADKNNEGKKDETKKDNSTSKKQSLWKRLKQWISNKKNGTKALPEGNTEDNEEDEMKNKKEKFLNRIIDEAKTDGIMEYSNSDQSNTIELQNPNRDENDDEYDRTG